MPTYRQGAKPLHDYLREHARTQPDKPAFIWYGTRITYAELDAWSDAFAAALQTLGVRQGDRVALFLNNCPQYVVAHFGIQKAGAIVGPCGPLFKAMELEYQLKDLGAEYLFFEDDSLFAKKKRAYQLFRLLAEMKLKLLDVNTRIALTARFGVTRSFGELTADSLFGLSVY